jgi:hypothetical protein
MLRVVSGLEAVAVAASVRVEVDRWRAEFDWLFARVAGRFAQVQSRLRARGYLLGLLSQSERKNGWTIAEFAGDADPQGMQRPLNHYRWDADAARDDLRGYVVERLGVDNVGHQILMDPQIVRKGTDLNGWTADQLDSVAAELNDRPRLCLDGRTPRQAMQRWAHQQAPR